MALDHEYEELLEFVDRAGALMRKHGIRKVEAPLPGLNQFLTLTLADAAPTAAPRDQFEFRDPPETAPAPKAPRNRV